MKTLLYPDFLTLNVAEQPMPMPGPGEALMRVDACGICGSELDAYRHKSPRRPPPLVMGHEFCGTLVSAPDNSPFAAGQRVVSNSLVNCGTCTRCRRDEPHLCVNRQIYGMHRAGAFAEYVSVRVDALMPWPEPLSAAQASLAEPLGNGVHVVNLARPVNPQTVLVIGAGPIGLLTSLAFQAMLGCTVWQADVKPDRLALAAKLGATAIFNPREQDVAAEIRALTEGDGADVVVDAVGSSATKALSVQASRPGGASIWIGLHDNLMDGFASYDLTLHERRVIGSYGATTADMRHALSLMTTSGLDFSSWVDTYTLDSGVEAFNRMLTGAPGDIKAVLTPGGVQPPV
jgi:threonine dehydrogenase-like Zn-dependent dehydrogenase